MSRRSQTEKRPAGLDVSHENRQESPSDREALKRWWARWDASAMWTGLFLAALVLVTVFLYRPALNRVFAGDQLCYLAELNGSQSLWDGLRHYDYGVTRHYDKGDESLYRPLLFVWLALNHWLFGNHYFCWNVVNLGLHLVVVMLLFALLRTIQPSPMAGAFAALFAVMPSQVDLVVWNHLGGYLAGFACLLLALIALHHAIEEREPSRVPWLGVYVLTMTAAALFYEVLVVMSALVALYLFCLELWRGRPRRWLVVAASLIPGLVFTGLYVVHVFHCQRLFYLDHTEPQSQVVARVLGQALQQNGAWLRQAFCPWVYSYITPVISRHHLTQIDVVQLITLPALLVTAACLLLLIGAWKCFTLRRLVRRIPLLLTVIALMAAYAIIIAIGRHGVFATCAYYAYFFSLLLMIALYVLPDWSPDRLRLSPALCGVAVLILFNGYFTYDATTRIGRANEEMDRYLTSVRRFVAEHRHEPGFSFAMQGPDGDEGEDDTAEAPDNLNPTVWFHYGYPDTATEMSRWPLLAILFPRYYNTWDPRYLMVWKDGALVALEERGPETADR